MDPIVGMFSWEVKDFGMSPIVTSQNSFMSALQAPQLCVYCLLIKTEMVWPKKQ